MITIDIISLFPKMFDGPFSESMIKRAQEKGLARITIHNLRQWTTDRHQTVDDKPFGGGPGMVMMPEPIAACLDDLKGKNPSQKPYVIYMSPKGNLFNQSEAKSLSKKEWLIILCGHYEGIDQRIIDHYIDEEVSIGDFVLTGGELPSMIITDTVVRLVPGVVQAPDGTTKDSFSGETKLLEYPQYTRPADFRGHKVPDVLLSGNHKDIEVWQQQQAVALTRQRRKDLLK